MKESIAGISIFQIVIVFIITFAGIMALTINHAKAFGVKDEIVTIIETSKNKNGKLSDGTINQIITKLGEVGYRATSKCEEGWTGYTRDGRINNGNAAFCVKANDVAAAYSNDASRQCNGCGVVRGDFPKLYYYDIALFYQLDIPILNNLMRFTLKGSTKTISG